MRPDMPHIAVIGGGATGCGVARDLALRGFRVTLIETGDLGCGTSSRFHGMLQSGARYAVSDWRYAAECMRDRRAVAQLAPEAVEETGGLFVSLDSDPADYADKFAAGCKQADIPVEELDPDRVMAEEPAISRRVRRAFAVPDATIQPWRYLNLLADDIRHHGGMILTRHRVTSVRQAGGRIAALTVEGGGATREIAVDGVVNAGGPWSGAIARLLGTEVSLELTKGSILVFAHRLVSRAINRCRPPSSHDIMVPTGTISLFGTTSEVVDDPAVTSVSPAEVQALLDGAEPLIPGIRNYRALRAWAGVRPLVRPAQWPAGKSLPRRHEVIDHAMQGLVGAFTVCGGSFTSHRTMGADTADHVCRLFGINEPSRAAETPLARIDGAGGWRPSANYEQVESSGRFTQLLCECENVPYAAVDRCIEEGGLRSLNDLRRRLRVGFGPCQGTFCGARLASLVAEAGGQGHDELERFWAERIKGASLTGWGANARQLMLSDLVCRENLGIVLRPSVDPRIDTQ